jgi:hypothetical protein
MGGQGLPSFVNVCSIPWSETGLSPGERFAGGSRTQQVHPSQLPCNLRQNRVGYT